MTRLPRSRESNTPESRLLSDDQHDMIDRIMECLLVLQEHDPEFVRHFEALLDSLIAEADASST